MMNLLSEEARDKRPMPGEAVEVHPPMLLGVPSAECQSAAKRSVSIDQLPQRARQHVLIDRIFDREDSPVVG